MYVDDIQVVVQCCCRRSCEYHIKVFDLKSSDRSSTLIYRSYIDFLEFDRRLKEKLPSLKDLPRLPPPDPPETSSRHLKLSMLAAESRKVQFNEYLNKIWDLCEAWSQKKPLEEELERFFGFRFS